MNPNLTTLDPVATPAHSKTILSEDGFKCSVISLAPRDETPRDESEHLDEHVLYVVEGEVTVRFDSVNTILTKDKALLIPKGKHHVISAHPGGRAKLLRTEVPSREVVVPPLVSLER
jgi:mannose-6-phosphate isomerase-like protein (cupin superfamily)